MSRAEGLETFVLLKQLWWSQLQHFETLVMQIKSTAVTELLKTLGCVLLVKDTKLWIIQYFTEMLNFVFSFLQYLIHHYIHLFQSVNYNYFMTDYNKWFSHKEHFKGSGSHSNWAGIIVERQCWLVKKGMGIRETVFKKKLWCLSVLTCLKKLHLSLHEPPLVKAMCNFTC